MMADIVDRATRSRMMSGIRGKDTRPEMILRKGLHFLGYRYRLHVRELPGKPDLVFPKYNAIILVHGCFWHGHDCKLFRWPASNVTFWKTKIRRNREVDRKTYRKLKALGWRILTVWECCLKGTGRIGDAEVLRRAVSWLTTDQGEGEIIAISRQFAGKS